MNRSILGAVHWPFRNPFCVLSAIFTRCPTTAQYPANTRIVCLIVLLWSMLGAPASSTEPIPNLSFNPPNGLGVFDPGNATSPWPRCKYSVRDVAFVNVHGKPWQLELIKSKGISETKFASLNQILQAKLEHSNVTHVWLDADSSEASHLRENLRFAHADSSTTIDSAITDSTGQQTRFLNQPLNKIGTTEFAKQLDLLLDSPKRDEILAQLVDALCVIVLVESGEANKDEIARTRITDAIQQLERQMWTLEKATDKGPVLVTVPYESQSERWLLHSLQLNDLDSPGLAIVFGQGRRLGDILAGDAITSEAVLGRASICGQSCECSLDRNWLYGGQMIHVWSQQLERAAESSLTFDPNSAFVIAEISQIIRKNSTTNGVSPRVNLGGGLVIHDLDTMPNASAADNPQLATAESDSQPPDLLDHPDAPPSTTEEPTDIGTSSSFELTGFQSEFPVSLIAVLAAIAVGFAGWLIFCASRT